VNRLWVKLSLAFAGVVVVAVAAVALLLNWQTGAQFREYVTHSGLVAEGGLVQGLAAYYEEHGSWEGVDRLLQVESLMQDWRGRWRSPTGAGVAGLVLVDANGRVLYGPPGRFSLRQLSNAVPVEVDGRTVGYVTAGVARAEALGPLEQGFLYRLRRSLVLGAGLAGALALVLGLLLSRSLSAPLRGLAAAARAVASRDFSQRVEITGSSEMVEVANSFNEMTAALQQAELLRQNLMADVAHELRTPLTVLQGNLRALLDDVYPMEKSEVAQLYDETRLLSRLVEDLRELALAEAGQLRLNLRPVDVSSVIEAAASNFELLAEESQIALDVKADPGLPKIMADPDRVTQVLRNLLVNALRYTSSGGRISITAQPVDQGVRIAVADTGEGIRAEDLPHVFDRFWSAEPSRARDLSGSGLGLTIARQLVQSQRGTIGVESQAGRGSRFWFILPSEA
jgi:two-component system OmpR family sensor kinase